MTAARKPHPHGQAARDARAGRQDGVRRADASLIEVDAGSTDPGEASRTEQIVQAVTQAIIAHRLKPGEKLVEQRLGDRFQVSRTVVRQALQRLAEMKLVQLEPARGAFVAAPSVREAREVFAVRQMIESQMLDEVVAQASAADLRRLRAHLKAEGAAVRGDDVSQRTRLLFDFHVRLAEVLGNSVLVQWMQELVSRCSLISLMYQSSDDAQASHAEHAALLAAIEARDAGLAQSLLQRHLSVVVDQITRAPALVHAGTPPASPPAVRRKPATRAA